MSTELNTISSNEDMKDVSVTSFKSPKSVCIQLTQLTIKVDGKGHQKASHNVIQLSEDQVNELIKTLDDWMA